MRFCFATNNPKKLEEVKALVRPPLEIISLQELGCIEELPENQKTLEGNSQEKAEYLYKKYQVNCFADDTGLEVHALDGEPGVMSARYAGPQRSSLDNMNLLLEKLHDKTNRKAQFRTVITLIIDGKIKQFEGIVKGKIITEKHGTQGFGYDPIFIPDGYEKTFAEMSLAEKNKISHRSIALEKLIQYLNEKLLLG